ncbi:dTDP-glucose 4,6-dehydratase [Evansella halocellulosilytica]|uniref:dTDP-glucose 4,6-dehydratase n=1 Tax=Evansella halocellulosilytica TaxID=2011013 RepID=UPI000BB6BAC5|nr:dTDP-glucose 4,6-dehydratase [Evansella halocellulosilytica]
MKQLLVTGGAGFIGSNFIEYMLDHQSYQITNIDAFTYAANEEYIKKFNEVPHYRLIKGDISKEDELERALDRQYDAIINFAAESHVDRSINRADQFYESNIKGTLNLLYAVLEKKANRLIQISTDEVYGSLDKFTAPFTEKSPLKPNNPYSASKAGADLLVRSFVQTYKLPLIITRCSNNYGPQQNKEKFIPKVITNAMKGEPIPLYGDGMNIRDWIHVSDHCRAVHFVLERGVPGEVYNIGGHEERTNIDVIKAILKYLRKDEALIEYVDDRKGHDRRYSIDFTKINTELGWEPKVQFEEGIIETIKWYQNQGQLGGNDG